MTDEYFSTQNKVVPKSKSHREHALKVLKLISNKNVKTFQDNKEEKHFKQSQIPAFKTH